MAKGSFIAVATFLALLLASPNGLFNESSSYVGLSPFVDAQDSLNQQHIENADLPHHHSAQKSGNAPQVQTNVDINFDDSIPKAHPGKNNKYRDDNADNYEKFISDSQSNNNGDSGAVQNQRRPSSPLADTNRQKNSDQPSAHSKTPKEHIGDDSNVPKRVKSSKESFVAVPLNPYDDDESIVSSTQVSRRDSPSEPTDESTKTYPGFNSISKPTNDEEEDQVPATEEIPEFVVDPSTPNRFSSFIPVSSKVDEVKSSLSEEAGSVFESHSVHQDHHVTSIISTESSESPEFTTEDQEPFTKPHVESQSTTKSPSSPVQPTSESSSAPSALPKSSNPVSSDREEVDTESNSEYPTPLEVRDEKVASNSSAPAPSEDPKGSTSVGLDDIATRATTNVASIEQTTSSIQDVKSTSSSAESSASNGLLNAAHTHPAGNDSDSPDILELKRKMLGVNNIPVPPKVANSTTAPASSEKEEEEEEDEFAMGSNASSINNRVEALIAEEQKISSKSETVGMSGVTIPTRHHAVQPHVFKTEQASASLEGNDTAATATSEAIESKVTSSSTKTEPTSTDAPMPNDQQGGTVYKREDTQQDHLDASDPTADVEYEDEDEYDDDEEYDDEEDYEDEDEYDEEGDVYDEYQAPLATGKYDYPESNEHQFNIPVDSGKDQHVKVADHPAQDNTEASGIESTDSVINNDKKPSKTPLSSPVTSEKSGSSDSTNQKEEKVTAESVADDRDNLKRLLGIWPQPASHVSNGTDISWIDPSTVNVVIMNGDSTQTPQQQSCKNVIDYNAQLALGRIKTDDFVPWKFFNRDTTFDPSTSNVTSGDASNKIQSINIYQLRPASTAHSGEPTNFRSECPDMSSLNTVTRQQNSKVDGTNALVDESYKITIDVNSINIYGNSTLGIVRALQTLPQLVFAPVNPDSTAVLQTNSAPKSDIISVFTKKRLSYCKPGQEAEKGKWTKQIWDELLTSEADIKDIVSQLPTCNKLKYIPNLPMEIADYPGFEHRGINLDIARNFIPMSQIKSVVEQMSYSKLNTLHLHITDAQSWPLKFNSMPEIAEKGAYYDGLYYTEDEVKDLIKFASIRGVQILPEIDIPGHITSLSKSHPEVIVGANVLPNWYDYAAEPPSGQLKINDSPALNITTHIIGELQSLFNSNKIHLGGDEFNKKIYELDEEIKSSNETLIKQYFGKFADEIISDAVDRGLQIGTVWEEMILEWGFDKVPSTRRPGEMIVNPKRFRIQMWRGANETALNEVLSRGFNVILGTADYWYLDCGVGQWLDPSQHSPVKSMSTPATGNNYGNGDPLQDWCSPKKSWRRIYENKLSTGSVATQLQVLGGEVHLWTEQTDAGNMDSMLFPRAFAAAEILWTPLESQIETQTNYVDVTQRLARLRERLHGSGLQSAPVQMIWCLQNPGGCQA